MILKVIARIDAFQSFRALNHVQFLSNIKQIMIDAVGVEAVEIAKAEAERLGKISELTLKMDILESQKQKIEKELEIVSSSDPLAASRV